MALTAARQQEIERLFREYGKGIGGYVYARVGDAELAEEITSRVFLQLVRAHDQLRGPPLPWLWSIVRNELARCFRSPRKRQPLDESMMDTRLLPVEELEQRERDQKLQSSLARLSDEDQEIVAMKFFLSMTHRDIAVAMKMTSSLIGVRVFRAIQQLRGWMEQPAASIDPARR